MEKKYLIEFTHADGSVEEVELVTDRLKSMNIDKRKTEKVLMNLNLGLYSFALNKNRLLKYSAENFDYDFDAAMNQELGTFFLTDYMVRHFERIVMKGMGLRDHPRLRDIYFAHYRRILYIARIDGAALVEKVRQAAAKFQLDYDYHYTGCGD